MSGCLGWNLSFSQASGFETCEGLPRIDILAAAGCLVLYFSQKKMSWSCPLYGIVKALLLYHLNYTKGG